MHTEELDIAIIGAGPAGLAAALELRIRGFSKLAVLERETDAGGIPRHCGHPPFGWREYRRIMDGRNYANRLIAEAKSAGISIRTRTTVTDLQESGLIEVTSPEGTRRLAAKRVILATGGRETTRAARLVGGTRPRGVLNTGALQQMVYRKKRIPFRRPAIVGSELVSFSAALTCRKAGVRPVAMIEELPHTIAPWPCSLYPMMLGVPIYHGATVQRVYGSDRVEGLRVRLNNGRAIDIDCDGVLFTGRFVPEASLVQQSHLVLDPTSGGPKIDQSGRMSDDAYYAAGNVLRPIETAGWSWLEGRMVGAAVAEDLNAAKPPGRHIASISIKDPIKFAVPQLLTIPAVGPGLKHLQLRVRRPVTGELQIQSEGTIIWRRHIRTMPERRLLVPLESFVDKIGSNSIVIDVKEHQPRILM